MQHLISQKKQPEEEKKTPLYRLKSLHCSTKKVRCSAILLKRFDLQYVKIIINSVCVCIYVYIYICAI